MKEYTTKEYKAKIIELSRQLDTQQDYKQVKEENKLLKKKIAQVSVELDAVKNYNKRFSHEIQLKTEILQRLDELIEDKENRWQMIKDFARKIYDIDVKEEIWKGEDD